MKENDEKWEKVYQVTKEISKNKLNLQEARKLTKYIIGLMLTSPKITRVSGVFNMFEINPITKGKLEEIEKENIIICIWSCLFYIYEDGTKGIDSFESIEDIEYVRRKDYDYIFNYKNKEEKIINLTGKFGYEKTNPIQVNSIGAINEYFKKLRTKNNHPILWHRIGSYSADEFDGPTDIYEILYKSGNLFNTKKKTLLYINMYNLNNSNIAPEGFNLVY